MVWLKQPNEHALCLVSSLLGADGVWETIQLVAPQESPPTRSMVGPPQGLPRRGPECILGTKIVKGLLVPMMQ